MCYFDLGVWIVHETGISVFYFGFLFVCLFYAPIDPHLSPLVYKEPGGT